MRVRVQDNDAGKRVTATITNMIKMLNPNKDRPTVLLNIGSDRLTGDALGPLVGTRISEISSLPVYGTLDEPVHAVNLAEKIEEIKLKHSNPLIIAVDACLTDKAANVGTISITKGSMSPGAGVNKDLPEVGEISIAGVVNVGGFLEFLTLQNTRLGVVMKLANCIAENLAAATREETELQTSRCPS